MHFLPLFYSVYFYSLQTTRTKKRHTVDTHLHDIGEVQTLSISNFLNGLRVFLRFVEIAKQELSSEA